MLNIFTFLAGGGGTTNPPDMSPKKSSKLFWRPPLAWCWFIWSYGNIYRGNPVLVTENNNKKGKYFAGAAASTVSLRRSYPSRYILFHVKKFLSPLSTISILHNLKTIHDLKKQHSLSLTIAINFNGSDNRVTGMMNFLLFSYSFVHDFRPR